MGKCISALEKWFRGSFAKGQRGERIGGILLAIILPVGTFLITGACCLILWKIHPLACLALQIFWCFQALAVKGMRREGQNIFRALSQEGLEAGRKAVARVVGRDTDALSEKGVVKAAVETIAENYSDGVAAPLFYMIIGGAPLALTYKAINTMDSMVGYKNEKYLYFGRAAARLDDVANYIPSRLAALFWILAAAVTGFDAKGAIRIWKRDRRNHPSPNSAQTESCCAGALGIQLAGPAWYFGKLYDKPTIGDDLREPVPEDIHRTNRMFLAASLLAAGIFIVIRLAVVLAMA